MRHILFQLFILSFVVLTDLSAQIGTFYSTDKELSSTLINAIYQDSRSYIWIATEDGLNKFDGVRFTIYRANRGDSTTLNNNYVRSLLEDSQGRFWVGCINSLHLYNRTTDDFCAVQLFYNDSVIHPHITSIMECKEGEIWMTTSGLGVIRIQRTDSRYSVDTRLSGRMSSMHLTVVYQDSRGSFWFASENQGLNFYNPKTDELRIFKAPQSIGSNQISAIREDSEGNLFVGTLTNGLFRYNTERQVFESIPHLLHSSLSVKSLVLNNKNRLLVATDGQGIKVLNSSKRVLEDYPIHSASIDFSRMKVHAICQDKVGNLWIGLFQKGVFLDPESPNKFNYWGYKSFQQNIIGSGCVMSLLQDKKGMLWVGTDNDGIYRIDSQGVSRHFEPRDDRGNVPGTVLSMIEDDRGTIWIGSYLNGLVGYDKKTDKFTSYDHSDSMITSDNTARNKIFSLAKDDEGFIWIGTNGAGIFVFDPEHKKYVRHYSQHGEPGRQIPNNWINYITTDSKGLIWAGSYNGVISINTQSSEIIHYTTESEVIPGSVVFYITEDSRGYIWIGTTEGLARFDRSRLESELFTTANGLSSNVICSILEDHEGNMWISTHSGISKYNRSEAKFVNYYAFDGLQGNEFSQGAAYKSARGELFFGGINGVTYFDPADINDQRVPLNLYMTALYVLDRKVFSGEGNGRCAYFNGFIADADTLWLGHSDTMFALEFSTFDFGFSERVQYSYLLEGLNTQWMTTEPGINRINFTNLSHGTYTLKVRAMIYDNFSEEKLITIVVFPPWYHTWWATMIYFILFSLFVLGVTKFIYDRIQYRNEKIRREHAEQISEAKLQFFINVSHEIRTPMSLILSPLEKLISENKELDKQKVFLLMYRNAQRILTLVNQLMDVRKIDKGLMSVSYRETDMVGFIDDLMQTFEYQANKRNIKFTFIHPDNKLKVWVDMQSFDKVLVNVLSNAFKFTPDDGEIIVLLRKGANVDVEEPLKNYFEIVVSDTGIGIEEDKMEKIFERFYQINKHEHSGFGTGIGLHLARSLVMLQHGQLFARNRAERKGSEFVIRMPLGNSHIQFSEIEQLNGTVALRSKTDQYLQDSIQMGEHEHSKVKSKTHYKILVVDDEDDIRQYLRDELSERYKVSVAVNGKEALKFILQEKPNLVVSDVVMPEMDGIALTKKIKSNININHIPIILLTAKASDEDKAEGLEIGADAYVAKPFNIDLLKVRISNLLENRERLEHKASDSVENKALIKPVLLKSSDQILYEKIIRIINDNISDPDLNVEFLANGVGMSRVHMHRKLKELTNQSARDFIRSIRLKQAADLLAGQKLTVSEVVYALGFTNLSHFSTIFREFYGVSPREYAEKNRKDTGSGIDF
jgi:ligand-binding sensor domain-containing protein/signal transduction histidine kinase/AraC-like DNA-binding protein